MKDSGRGELVFAICALLFILWQLVQAVWLGRIYDFLFHEDFLFFFEDPIQFVLHFAAYVAVAFWIVKAGTKKLRSRAQGKSGSGWK